MRHPADLRACPTAAPRIAQRGVAAVRTALVLGLVSVGLLTAIVVAGDFRISAFDVRNGTATVAFAADTNRYYLLERAQTPTGAWQAVVMGRWSTPTGSLADAPLPAGSAFYSVLSFPVAGNGDWDGDGIPDWYELEYPQFLDPLNPNDAGEDYDWDGYSNLEEYLLGSDPADPSSPNPMGELRILALRLSSPTDEVEFTSLSGNYYILLAGLTPTNVTTPVAMGLGLTNHMSLYGPRQSPACFYRVEGVHKATPLDTDGDGMDDVFELQHGLNPLQPDGQQDADGDGYPNFYEYLYGTAPDDPTSVPAPTRYVDASALPGGDGSAVWPHASLAEALAAASDYDIIRVADGVYTGPLNRNLACGGKPLLIISQHGPAHCILDCGWGGQAFLLDGRDGDRTAIVGLTIRNGYGANGGAVSCDGASAVIDGCCIETSLADAGGGGVSCSGGAPLFRNCTFASNSAWFGGGLYVTTAAASFTNCQFIGNGAVCGGGAYCQADGPVFRRCTFADNRATEGAGLFGDQSSLQLLACRVQGGVANDCGGGVFCQGGSPLCENGLFTGNEATTAGGAFFITNANPVLRNCTVADNCALLGGGVACADAGSAPQVVNCILWGNRIGQFAGGTPSVSFSTVEGGCAAAGVADPPAAHNLALDPLFNADYRLQTASPCIDAGTAEGVPATDLTGAARWDHPGHSNVVSIVDLGAFEFVDTDHDGMDDNWEVQNFGTLLRDGTGDDDGDGLTDLAEYQAGTDPTRPDTAASVYLATHPQLELDMPGVDANGKTNVMLFCSGNTFCRPVYACLDRAFRGGIVTLRRSSALINVWSAAGSKPVLVGGILSKSWDLADATQDADFRAVQGDLWVQGVTPGTATLTLSYTFMPDATDNLRFHVSVATLSDFSITAGVTNIKFNHTPASSTNDALDIRPDGGSTYDLSGGEWVNGGTNIPVCYRVGTRATVKARFVIQPASLTSAVVSAIALNAGASLSGIQATRIAFTNGVSNPEYVMLPLAGPAPAAVRKSADVWQWSMGAFNGDGTPAVVIGTSGVHTVYTVLAAPVAPWTNAAASTHVPWSSVLDRACDWAAGASNADGVVAALTPHAYAGFGKVYDGTQSHSYGTTCHLSAMLSDSVVDCQDMSAVMQLFSAALGVSGVQVRRVDGPFVFQPLLPIGQTDWTSGAWNFHQLGWYEGTVNDACATLREAAPYVPVHDDLNGNYKNNLFSSGTWSPYDPASYADFD